MHALLWFGLVMTASTPDATPRVLPESLQAVVSCPLPVELGEVERETAKFVAVGSARAVSFRESTGSWGTTGLVSWKEWLVFPGSCRRMALWLVCQQGAPDCSARILHLPDQPPTDVERRLLRSWLGGARRDPRRPDHQSALVGSIGEPLPSPPELPEPSEDGVSTSEEEPAPLTARAVSHPLRPWMQGRLVPQTRSWTESDTPEEPHAVDEAPEGFLASGRSYSLHRGDLHVHPKKSHSGGASRLHLYSSGGRWAFQRMYVALEQPASNRSQWLFTGGQGLRVLGMHRGRVWLECPAFMDPGFTLTAIDMGSGAVWSLALNDSPTFESAVYRALRVTSKGLLLENREGQQTMLIPWKPLEEALREAKRPTRGR